MVDDSLHLLDFKEMYRPTSNKEIGLHQNLEDMKTHFFIRLTLKIMEVFNELNVPFPLD